MNNLIKENIMHFVEYNSCHISRRVARLSIYIFIVLVCFSAFIAIYVDNNDYYRNIFPGRAPATEFISHIIIITITIIYSISAIVIPPIIKKRKRILQTEELVFYVIWYCFFGGIGLLLMGAFAFVYTTQGIIKTVAITLGIIIVDVRCVKTRKKLIEELVFDGGFNAARENEKFIKFDKLNTFIWETHYVYMVGMAVVLFLKQRTIGITILGIFFSAMSVVTVDICICCTLQIKYARQFGIQEYLPQKSIRENKSRSDNAA